MYSGVYWTTYDLFTELFVNSQLERVEVGR